ncbi:MAG: hypothetical protein Q9203_001926 [Teloschistes exilis]
MAPSASSVYRGYPSTTGVVRQQSRLNAFLHWGRKAKRRISSEKTIEADSSSEVTMNAAFSSEKIVEADSSSEVTMDAAGIDMASFLTLKEVYLLSKFLLKMVSSAAIEPQTEKIRLHLEL